VERYAKENVIIILVGNKIDMIQKESSNQPSQSRNMKKKSHNPFSLSSHNHDEEEEEEEENHISSTKTSKRSTSSEIDQLVLEFIELYPSTVHFQVSAKTNTNISHLFSYLCEEMITKQLKERQLFLQNSSSSSSDHKFRLIGETISLSSDSSSRRNRRKEDGGWGFNCCGSY